ncbi:hypothetical protein BGZ60DRAFT_518528 [Tricladium varicosporioides]|nr:hypothetical protein BGZ60DRAFT_518528 [Hymenoscyphus varicosporioides]
MAVTSTPFTVTSTSLACGHSIHANTSSKNMERQKQLQNILRTYEADQEKIFNEIINSEEEVNGKDTCRSNALTAIRDAAKRRGFPIHWSIGAAPSTFQDIPQGYSSSPNQVTSHEIHKLRIPYHLLSNNSKDAKYTCIIRNALDDKHSKHTEAKHPGISKPAKGYPTYPASDTSVPPPVEHIFLSQLSACPQAELQEINLRGGFGTAFSDHLRSPIGHSKSFSNSFTVESSDTSDIRRKGLDYSRLECSEERDSSGLYCDCMDCTICIRSETGSATDVSRDDTLGCINRQPQGPNLLEGDISGCAGGQPPVDFNRDRANIAASHRRGISSLSEYDTSGPINRRLQEYSHSEDDLDCPLQSFLPKSIDKILQRKPVYHNGNRFEAGISYLVRWLPGWIPQHLFELTKIKGIESILSNRDGVNGYEVYIQWKDSWVTFQGWDARNVETALEFISDTLVDVKDSGSIGRIHCWLNEAFSNMPLDLENNREPAEESPHKGSLQGDTFPPKHSLDEGRINRFRRTASDKSQQSLIKRPRIRSLPRCTENIVADTSPLPAPLQNSSSNLSVGMRGGASANLRRGKNRQNSQINKVGTDTIRGKHTVSGKRPRFIESTRKCSNRAPERCEDLNDFAGYIEEKLMEHAYRAEKKLRGSPAEYRVPRNLQRPEARHGKQTKHHNETTRQIGRGKLPGGSLVDINSKSLKDRTEDEIRISEDEIKGSSHARMATQRKKGGLLSEDSEEMSNLFKDLQGFTGLRSDPSCVGEMQPLLGGLRTPKVLQPNDTTQEQRVKKTKQSGGISCHALKMPQGQESLTQPDSGGHNHHPSSREESLTQKEIHLLRKRKQKFENTERELKRRGTY